MCCTRKNTVGERSGAAKLRSGAASRVFACAAQASCAAAHATALAIWTDFGTTAFDSLSTAANSTFARRNRAQQLPDILGRRDAKNSSCKWFYTRAVRERRVRRESPRCNFSRPSVFANFEAHGIVSRELWNAAKPLTRLQRICEPCQPGALSRERTRECKSAEQMDARYARGRTALVERRERFYGLGSRLPRHLAPLFPKTQFLKSTKRVSQGLFRW